MKKLTIILLLVLVCVGFAVSLTYFKGLKTDEVHVMGDATIDSTLVVNGVATFGNSIVIEQAFIGSGGIVISDTLNKMIKIGSHTALIFGVDTMWCAKDTSGF